MWVFKKTKYGIPKYDTDKIPMPKCEPPMSRKQFIFVLIETFEDRKYIQCFFEKASDASEYCERCNKTVTENNIPSWFTYEKVYNYKDIKE